MDTPNTTSPDQGETIKHTPGPWEVLPAALKFTRLVTKNVDGPLHFTVADVNGLVEEEAVANANLIAAAPELLAVLAWAVRQTKYEYSMVDDPRNLPLPLWMHGAEEAIRKARGQA